MGLRRAYEDVLRLRPVRQPSAQAEAFDAAELAGSAPGFWTQADRYLAAERRRQRAARPHPSGDQLELDFAARERR